MALTTPTPAYFASIITNSLLQAVGTHQFKWSRWAAPLAKSRSPPPLPTTALRRDCNRLVEFDPVDGSCICGLPAARRYFLVFYFSAVERKRRGSRLLDVGPQTNKAALSPARQADMCEWVQCCLRQTSFIPRKVVAICHCCKYLVLLGGHRARIFRWSPRCPGLSQAQSQRWIDRYNKPNSPFGSREPWRLELRQQSAQPC